MGSGDSFDNGKTRAPNTVAGSIESMMSVDLAHPNIVQTFKSTSRAMMVSPASCCTQVPVTYTIDWAGSIIPDKTTVPMTTSQDLSVVYFIMYCPRLTLRKTVPAARMDVTA